MPKLFRAHSLVRHLPHFFPVGDDIEQIVVDWVHYLKDELLFGNDDPLFPKTRVVSGDDRVFKACGFLKEHWVSMSVTKNLVFYKTL